MKVNHAVCIAEISVGADVECVALEAELAARAVLVTVGVDACPFRLVFEVSGLDDSVADIKLPVAGVVELDIVVVILRAAQPNACVDTVILGVVGQGDRDALLCVIGEAAVRFLLSARTSITDGTVFPTI